MYRRWFRRWGCSRWSRNVARHWLLLGNLPSPQGIPLINLLPPFSLPCSLCYRICILFLRHRYSLLPGSRFASTVFRSIDQEIAASASRRPGKSWKQNWAFCVARSLSFKRCFECNPTCTRKGARESWREPRREPRRKSWRTASLCITKLQSDLSATPWMAYETARESLHPRLEILFRPFVTGSNEVHLTAIF